MKVTIKSPVPEVIWLDACKTKNGKFYRDVHDNLYLATSCSFTCLTHPGRTYGSKKRLMFKVRAVETGTKITIEV